MNKLLFGISLAKKSGKLVCGFDPVKVSVLSGKAHMVILTQDTSEKTIKRVKFFCEDIIQPELTTLTQFEVSGITGRLTGILAIEDENMAILCKNALENK